jgi:hypothetical protein
VLYIFVVVVFSLPSSINCASFGYFNNLESLAKWPKMKLIKKWKIQQQQQQQWPPDCMLPIEFMCTTRGNVPAAEKPKEPFGMSMVAR